MARFSLFTVALALALALALLTAPSCARVLDTPRRTVRG
jgi:hypothetical protein